MCEILILLFTLLIAAIIALVAVPPPPAQLPREVRGGAPNTKKTQWSCPLHQSPAARVRTAMIFDSGELDLSKLRKALDGWEIVDTSHPPKHVDFVYADGKYLSDKRLYDVHARLKCRLQADALSDKAKLHERLMTAAPDVICETLEVREDTVLPDDGVPWIVRGNWGFAGSSNAIVRNTEELQAARARLMEQPKAAKAGSRIIMSKYIDDPMLLDGHKFHVRMNIMIVVLADGEKRAYANTGDEEIFMAKKPYVKKDYEDGDIHDTHWVKDSTEFSRPFPAALGAEGMRLRDAAHAALRQAIEACLPDIRNYPEARNGYEIFGADLMFTAAGEPKILEINFKPGLEQIQPDPRDYAEVLLNTIAAGAIDPAFGTALAWRDDTYVRLI